MKAAAKLGRRRFLVGGQAQHLRVAERALDPGRDAGRGRRCGARSVLGRVARDAGAVRAGKNFGSLIVPKLRDPAEVARVVRLKDFGRDLLRREVQERVLAVLRMAEALSPKYHVVVANPPYMNSGGMKHSLSGWIRDNYSNSRSDLMTCFMQRAASLSLRTATWGMMNLPILDVSDFF